jgi:hypothetical protein
MKASRDMVRRRHEAPAASRRMTGLDAGRQDNLRTWLVLCGILGLAAVVRLLSFRGYTTYDAAEYTRLAHMLPLRSDSAA